MSAARILPLAGLRGNQPSFDTHASGRNAGGAPIEQMFAWLAGPSYGLPTTEQVSPISLARPRVPDLRVVEPVEIVTEATQRWKVEPVVEAPVARAVEPAPAEVAATAHSPMPQDWAVSFEWSVPLTLPPSIRYGVAELALSPSPAPAPAPKDRKAWRLGNPKVRRRLIAPTLIESLPIELPPVVSPPAESPRVVPETMPAGPDAAELAAQNAALIEELRQAVEQVAALARTVASQAESSQALAAHMLAAWSEPMPAAPRGGLSPEPVAPQLTTFEAPAEAGASEDMPGAPPAIDPARLALQRAQWLLSRHGAPVGQSMPAQPGPSVAPEASQGADTASSLHAAVHRLLRSVRPLRPAKSR